MPSSLTNVTVRGYVADNPGDPVASVTLSGLVFQAGEDALWEFVSAVSDLVSQAQNVSKVVVTKYETVSTVV